MSTAEAEVVTCYTPQWEGIVEGWVTNHVHRNAWRMAPDYDEDDLGQEAFLVFARCRDNGTQFVNRQHFFGYFRTAFTNRLNDMAESRTRRGKRMQSATREGEDGKTQDILAMAAAPENVLEALMLQDLIMEVPEELRGFVALALEGDAQPKLKVDGVRETRIQWFCRLAGITATQENYEATQKSLEKWARKRLYE